MQKGQKMTSAQRKKISDGVRRQHAEGRAVVVGFSREARLKGRDANWKGESASLKAIHQWVARWKGKPRKCEFCGSTNSAKFEWANIDHKYRRVLEDYIRLCTRCHRNFDYSKLY